MDALPCVRPFVKWVGGKGRNLVRLVHYLPRQLPETYVEPFVGGGAMYFALGSHFSKNIINDANQELINGYLQVRDHVEDVISDLKACIYDEEFFYTVRNLDVVPGLDGLSAKQRAVRFIYLLRTCFNGLYRVNSKGGFNVPFGKYVNPEICGEERLRDCSAYLKDNPTEIRCQDYRSLFELIPAGAFVYIDPPYHPLSTTSYFTSYQSGIWGEKEQRQLRDFCDQLDRKGVYFMLSNSTASLIFDLYRHYRINTSDALRTINAKGDRSFLKEVVVTNYDEYYEHPEEIPLVKLSPGKTPQQKAEVNPVYTPEEREAALKAAFGWEVAAIAEPGKGFERAKMRKKTAKAEVPSDDDKVQADAPAHPKRRAAKTAAARAVYQGEMKNDYQPKRLRRGRPPKAVSLGTTDKERQLTLYEALDINHEET